MTQTWTAAGTRKIFLKNQKGINSAVAEEFEASRNPQEKEKAKVLLEPRLSAENPYLN